MRIVRMNYKLFIFESIWLRSVEFREILFVIRVSDEHCGLQIANRRESDHIQLRSKKRTGLFWLTGFVLCVSANPTAIVSCTDAVCTRMSNPRTEMERANKVKTPPRLHSSLLLVANVPSRLAKRLFVCIIKWCKPFLRTSIYSTRVIRRWLYFPRKRRILVYLTMPTIPKLATFLHHFTNLRRVS